MPPLRIHTGIVAAGLLAYGVAAADLGPSGARPSDPRASRWTANAQIAIAIGDQTNGSFAWRAGLQRWLRDCQALGIEAGRFYWDGRVTNGLTEHADFGAYQNLVTDPNTLAFVSGSFRVRSLREDARSAPYVALGIGAYRQAIDTDWAAGDRRDGTVRPGGSITFGGAGIRGLKPTMSFRYDWIDTKPGPSNYFSAAMGLQLDR